MQIRMGPIKDAVSPYKRAVRQPSKLADSPPETFSRPIGQDQATSGSGQAKARRGDKNPHHRCAERSLYCLHEEQSAHDRQMLNREGERGTHGRLESHPIKVRLGHPVPGGEMIVRHKFIHRSFSGCGGAEPGVVGHFEREVVDKFGVFDCESQDPAH